MSATPTSVSPSAMSHPKNAALRDYLGWEWLDAGSEKLFGDGAAVWTGSSSQNHDAAVLAKIARDSGGSRRSRGPRGAVTVATPRGAARSAPGSVGAPRASGQAERKIEAPSLPAYCGRRRSPL